MIRFLFGWLPLFFSLLFLTSACPSSPRLEPTVEAAAESSLEAAAEPSLEAAAEPSLEAAAEPSLEAAADASPQETAAERAAEPTFEVPEAIAEAAAEAATEAKIEATPETAVPLSGFGSIRGPCGVLDQNEWSSSSPFHFTNTLDFGSLTFDPSLLSVGGKKIHTDGNLGGNSVNSEIFAYEVLYRCELATLLKTEKEILYKSGTGKKTDLLVEIDGYKVGVSVTRAYHFPPENPYTVAEAQTLLSKKLSDILLSAANASPQDAWSRSMLFVLAYDSQYAAALDTAYQQIDAATRDKTILMVTITEGSDTFLYR